MKPPRIDWDFRHIPSNSDLMIPLGSFLLGGREVLIAVNDTRHELMFIWEEYYGKLIEGTDQP